MGRPTTVKVCVEILVMRVKNCVLLRNYLLGRGVIWNFLTSRLLDLYLNDHVTLLRSSRFSVSDHVTCA